MLANTFKSHDLNSTLDGVIHDRSLLGSKMLKRNVDGSYTGTFTLNMRIYMCVNISLYVYMYISM
jgi:hypothetical protein